MRREKGKIKREEREKKRESVYAGRRGGRKKRTKIEKVERKLTINVKNITQSQQKRQREWNKLYIRRELNSKNEKETVYKKKKNMFKERKKEIFKK